MTDIPKSAMDAAEEITEEVVEDDTKEIGTTGRGYTIWRTSNKDIGGFNYITDSSGCGHIITDSSCSIDELSMILNDMIQRQHR